MKTHECENLLRNTAIGARSVLPLFCSLKMRVPGCRLIGFT
jgi:hypothetical protein